MNIDTMARSGGLLSRLPRAELETLAPLAREARFLAGAILFEEDAPAESFFVISSGKVGLEMTSPGRAPLVIQTLAEGDMVGLSWLFPPYRWNWRSRAVVDTTAIELDAERVRAECAVRPVLAQRILEAVAKEAVERLHRTRLLLLDLYRGE